MLLRIIKHLKIKTLKIHLKFIIYNLKFLRIRKFFQKINNALRSGVCLKESGVVGANGYTLIEVVITMFITATVFVGVYALFAKAMKYDAEGRYEIIASELAQEGIEMIKNKKEKNEMDWAVWKPDDGDVNNISTFFGIDDSADCNPSLTWDNNGANYSFDCDKSNTVMQYNKDDKKFITGCSFNCVGPEFTRKCNVHAIHTNPVTLNADELRITCEVSWTSGVLNSSIATENKRTVKASLVLTDWER